MTNYGLFLEKLAKEFPKFELKKKTESSFMKILDFLLKLFTAWQANEFMDKFVTTVGFTVYVPDNWLNRSDTDKIIVLRHEAVHMRQRIKYGSILITLMYFLPIFPLGLAWGRAKLEREAYEESVRATAELKGKSVASSQRMRDFFVKQFITSAYGWMWPFSKTINAWFDKVVEGLK